MKKPSANLSDQVAAAKRTLAELLAISGAADNRVREARIETSLIRRDIHARYGEAEMLETRHAAAQRIAADAEVAVRRQLAEIEALESQLAAEVRRQLMTIVLPAAAEIVKLQDQLADASNKMMAAIQDAGERIFAGEIFPAVDSTEAALRNQIMVATLRLTRYRQTTFGDAEKEAA